MRTAVILFFAGILYASGVAIATMEKDSRNPPLAEVLFSPSGMPHLMAGRCPRPSNDHVIGSSGSGVRNSAPFAGAVHRAEASGTGTPSLAAGFIRLQGGTVLPAGGPPALPCPALEAEGPRFHMGDGMAWRVSGSSGSECGYVMPFLRNADLLAAQSRSLRRSAKPELSPP